MVAPLVTFALSQIGISVPVYDVSPYSVLDVASIYM